MLLNLECQEEKDFFPDTSKEKSEMTLSVDEVSYVERGSCILTANIVLLLPAKGLLIETKMNKSFDREEILKFS